MAFMKRIFFFLLLNIAVMTAISVVLAVVTSLGYMPSGYYSASLVMCLLWGMVGAFISLGMSRWAAKRFMGVQLIGPNSGGEAGQLVEKVYQLSRKAGIQVMPEVGIYESPEVNAFATGPTKNRSLVAVSTGLLHRLNDNEVEGVLGHEVAHIANGDMVTMALLQGVVNAFVMFFARIVAHLVSQQVREESRHIVYFATTIVFQILFMILGHFVIAAFSRWREFRADRGGARLAGRDKMIGALEALRRTIGPMEDMQRSILEANQHQHASIASLKISSGAAASWFSTHPPIEKRIMALSRGSD
ncbi:MAG: protease HtpX, partial [Bdellovibrionia bacterium]